MNNDLRGKCKEYAEQACKDNPNLELVRGYYYTLMLGIPEAHWWTRDKISKEIYDPTASQFDCNGLGVYEEVDGYLDCFQCGKSMHESEVSQAYICGRNKACCSGTCFGKCVGVI
jgi:hypothetical protein